MTLLRLEDVAVAYGSGERALRAVRGATVEVARGETVGLVGESGCGKSTLARAAVGLLPLAGGRILLDGEDVTEALRRRRRTVLRRIQLVFQDPRASLNPRMTVGETLAEAVLTHHRMRRAELRAELARLLDLVGLSATTLARHPHEFSGGQRQRIAIARALAVRPEILIADEITSALDVSVQASILNLLRTIQREVGIACLFISHDLAVVRYISRRVVVMHLGQVVEVAEPARLFSAPRHPYTRVLLDSLPALARPRGGAPLRALREPVDPHAPPAGCDFHTRCPVGPAADASRTICARVDPHGAASGDAHATACHFPLGVSPAREAER